jgi:hypothetical protein
MSITTRSCRAAAVAALLLVGCKRGPGEAGKFEDFTSVASTAGIQIPANCKKSNAGKVYYLDGFLHLGSDMRLEDGKTGLDFYRENDPLGAGKGNRITIKVSVGDWLRKGDVDDLWKAATKVASYSYRTQKGIVEESALRVHLAEGGSAGATDRIRLSFSVEPVPNIHQNMPLVCEYEFVSASRI